ncbi:hypothetical protein KHA80_21825 [Anaerobacillus sp. HL2]|nr:hypothetical protein KHA80_21825 [Anaerobacillus sp. HL2]
MSEMNNISRRSFFETFGQATVTAGVIAATSNTVFAEEKKVRAATSVPLSI